MLSFALRKSGRLKVNCIPILVDGNGVCNVFTIMLLIYL